MVRNFPQVMYVRKNIKTIEFPCLSSNPGVSFKCTGQELPFFVPWDGIQASASGTGILVTGLMLRNLNYVCIQRKPHEAIV